MSSLKTYLSAFEHSPTACIFLVPDAPIFTIAGVNAAFLSETHTSLEEIIGKSLFDAFPDKSEDSFLRRQEALIKTFEEVLFTKKAYNIEIHRIDVQLKGSEGFHPRFWNCYTYPILDENNNVKFIVQNPVDITSTILSYSYFNTGGGRLFSADKDAVENIGFDDCSDAIITLDLNSRLLSSNEILLNLLECPKEELLYSSFPELVGPLHSDRIADHMKRTLNGQIQRFEAPILTAKGNSLSFEIVSVPIVVNDEVIGAYLIAKDITANKETAILLDEQNQRIFNILESIKDGFFAVDRKWNITYCNRQAEILLKTSREAIMGKNLWNQYEEAIPLKFYSENLRSAAENIPVHFEEYLPSIDSWLEVSAYPSNDGLSIIFKNINDRIKTDKEIRLAKDKYQFLFDLSPLPTWVYDVKTLRFLDVNDAAIKTYGYSLDEFLSMTLRDIRPVEDVALLEKIVKRNIKPGVFNRSEVRHIKKSGEIIFTSIEGNSIPFDSKDARLVVAKDITEKVEAERALIASEQRFKALVQGSSDLIAILDKDGAFLYMSPSSLSILGKNADYFIGKSAFDYVHIEDLDKFRNSISKLSTRKSIRLEPFRTTVGGHVQWIESVLTNMTCNPTVAGIVVNARDITNRIEAENEIKENIERFTILSKATSDVVYDWDRVNNFIYWNKGLKGIFGYNPKDFITNESWNEVIHPDDLEQTNVNIQLNIKNRKSRWKNEYRVRCADGSYKFVLDRGFMVFKDDYPARMIGAIQDITDQVRHLKAIEDQNKALQEISWIQSHNVRAPLARIMGLTYLLKENEGENSTKELLMYLSESANELDSIIREIIQKTESAI